MAEADVGEPKKVSPETAIKSVKRLFVNLDFPRTFSTSQVDSEAIPDMARMVAEAVAGWEMTEDISADTPVLSPNIRRSTVGDLISIFERAFEGWQL